MNKFLNNKGQAMLITLLILSASFLIAMALGSLVLYELRSMIFTGESIKALYAAESGLEWKLFEIIKSTAIERPIMSNNSSFDVSVSNPPAGGTLIKSIGQSGNNFRALEASF